MRLFVDRRDLDEHREMVHKFGCGYCGKTFSTRDGSKSCYDEHPSLDRGGHAEMLPQREIAPTRFFKQDLTRQALQLLRLKTLPVSL